ncbi:MAG: hypothetical protein IPG67_15875 [Acidobacteria bacterium]|nr:hypothetical protein [Acidobacteriota bacterium]
MKKQSPSAFLLLIAVIIVGASIACSSSFSTNSSTSSPSNTAASPSPVNSSSPAKTEPAKKVDIAGKYDAVGSNPDGGGEYKAELTVTPRDDVYQFTWASGSKSYDGVGVLSDNRVAVSYTEGANGKGCGVSLFKIAADGSMTSKNGYWGENKMETETATRTSGSDLEGEFNIVGKNPKGETYKGTLKITKDGDGYVFNWNTGNSFSGFGIRAGEFVAVGFGGKQCAFVGYDVQGDGTLAGKWGSQNSKKFGTETAKPTK